MKKNRFVITAVIIFMIIMQMTAAYSVNAEASALSGRIVTKSGNSPAYGETLRVEFEGDSANKTVLSDYLVQWSIEGNVVSSDKEYVINEADCAKRSYVTDPDEKTISAQVTFINDNGDDEIISVEGVSFPTWEMPRRAGGHPQDKVTPVKQTVSSDDVFYVDGESFTMVKAFNNEKSAYFVAANKTYGKHSGGNSVKMDTDSEGNFSYWLNNDFLNKLNSDIVKYIDTEHLWSTEGAALAGIEDTYCFKAGVALLSAAELIRYKDTLAYDVDDNYWLRTPANYNQPRLMKINADDTNNNSLQVKLFQNGLDDTTPGIRPVFYLGMDFFRNVKIDIDNAGENVLEALRKNYSINELTDLYDETILENLGFSYAHSFSVKFSADNLSDIQELKADVSLEVNSGDAISGVAMLAVYDENGFTVSKDFKNISASAGENDIVTLCAENLQNMTDKCSAKVMVWNDAYHMRSIMQAVPFNTQ